MSKDNLGTLAIKRAVERRITYLEGKIDLMLEEQQRLETLLDALERPLKRKRYSIPRSLMRKGKMTPNRRRRR